MFHHTLTFILLFSAFTQTYALTLGMSSEEVQMEKGLAESTMTLGAKKVLIYEDGTRLEFIDGKLAKENNQTLAPAQETENRVDPLIKPEEIVQQRQKTTIGGSVQINEVDYASLSENYGNSKLLESLEDDIKASKTAGKLVENKTQKQRLREIAITFGIEMLVTYAVLFIAFQISGFPSIFRQLFSLSLAVALVGAILNTLLAVGPLNPIHSGLGFIILLTLIRQMTDVREWATAIKIALVARIISIAVIWLLMIGLTGFFSL